MSTTAALAVDWNRVVLNQMFHTLLTLLRRGEEGGQRKDRGRTEEGEGEGGEGQCHATQPSSLTFTVCNMYITDGGRNGFQ